MWTFATKLLVGMTMYDKKHQKGNFADLNKKQMPLLIGRHPVLGITCSIFFTCLYIYSVLV